MIALLLFTTIMGCMMGSNKREYGGPVRIVGSMFIVLSGIATASWVVTLIASNPTIHHKSLIVYIFLLLSLILIRCIGSMVYNTTLYFTVRFIFNAASIWLMIDFALFILNLK